MTSSKQWDRLELIFFVVSCFFPFNFISFHIFYHVIIQIKVTIKNLLPQSKVLCCQRNTEHLVKSNTFHLECFEPQFERWALNVCHLCLASGCTENVFYCIHRFLFLFFLFSLVSGCQRCGAGSQDLRTPAVPEQLQTKIFSVMSVSLEHIHMEVRVAGEKNICPFPQKTAGLFV